MLYIGGGVCIVLVLGVVFMVGFAPRRHVGFDIESSFPVANDDETRQSGALYRDAYPLRTIARFWEVAESQVGSRELDTCDEKLGRSLIDAYIRTRIDYCAGREQGGTNITCVSVKADPVSAWWPVPEAPCLSEGLHANGRVLARVGADITQDGHMLEQSLGHEKFVGVNLGEADMCGRETARTTMIICEWVVRMVCSSLARQDQWNPFHVGEDMVTTLVTALIALELDPSLADTRVQLVFNDDYGIEANHFVSMWDKIGAWAPRRLSLDPWDNECCESKRRLRADVVGRTIHSVGAGVSLLSAQGVSTE